MKSIFLAPPPWHVDENSVHSYWTRSISIVDSRGGVVAVTTRGYEGDADGDDCPSWTNAGLIAAAPELLEALKIYCHAHETGNSVPPKIVAEARAAIAKAEGQI